MDNPKILKEFKPISFYNVIYKIITKIIAKKWYMDFLIGLNQCSFILGRHSLDNTIIVQKAIHSYEGEKGIKRSQGNYNRFRKDVWSPWLEFLGGYIFWYWISIAFYKFNHKVCFYELHASNMEWWINWKILSIQGYSRREPLIPKPFYPTCGKIGLMY